ncbi:hypothetical protein [Variovorax soli]|uniref:hypothetical protein n=1 Tax=Variovorax soli TaxID=376815 RepID=UPI0008380F98|nr:hypothetical protein [Variovorax soli]
MKTSTLIGGVLAAIAVLCAVFFYADGVSNRRWIIEHNAFRTFVSPDGQYRIEYAATSTDFNWMRLYHTSDNEVIADRRFWGEPPYKINWYEMRVNVGGDDEATISLPPHWWERWTAKLP